MKVQSLLVLGSVCGIGLRSASNKAIGAQIGDLLAQSAGDMQLQQELSLGDASTNPAVMQVVKSANEKAGWGFFVELPTVNLHVEDHGNVEDVLLRAHMRDIRSRVEELKSAHSSFMRTEGISDAQREIKSMDFLRGSMEGGLAALEVGGLTARKALISLNNLASDPNARLAMQSNMSLYGGLKNFMSKESTPDQSRILAGSIITKLTGLPVASTSSDSASGSYGHVNIVLPSPKRVYAADADVLALRESA